MMKDDAAGADRRRLQDKLAPIGQEHLLAFWDELTSDQRHGLARQIDELDAELFGELKAEFRAAQNSAKRRLQMGSAGRPRRLAAGHAAGWQRCAVHGRGGPGQGRRAAAGWAGRDDPRGRRTGNAAGLRSAQGHVSARAAFEPARYFRFCSSSCRRSGGAMACGFRYM